MAADGLNNSWINKILDKKSIIELIKLSQRYKFSVTGEGGEIETAIIDCPLFKKDKPVKWKCRNCGYVHEGKDAPKLCLACKHPQSYYELLDDNF